MQEDRAVVGSLVMYRGCTGVGCSGSRSVLPSRGSGSLIGVWVRGGDPVSWGNIKFGEEIGDGSGVVGY